MLGKWHDVAVVLLLGFLCMLRPTEVLSLKRCAVLLPSDLLPARPLACVYIDQPKNRHVRARRKHVRLADAEVISFLERSFAHLAPQQLLFA